MPSGSRRAYGRQRYDGANPLALSFAPETRVAASVGAFDRWTVSPRLSLEYGGRYSRYDYIDGGLFSPRAAVTVTAAPGLRFRVAGGAGHGRAGRGDLPALHGPGSMASAGACVRHRVSSGPAAVGADAALRRGGGARPGRGLRRRAAAVPPGRRQPTGDAVRGGRPRDRARRLLPCRPGRVCGESRLDGQRAPRSRKPLQGVGGRPPSSKRNGGRRTSDRWRHWRPPAFSAPRSSSSTTSAGPSRPRFPSPLPGFSSAVGSAARSRAPTPRIPAGWTPVSILLIQQALPFTPVGSSRWEALLAVRSLFFDPRETASLFSELLVIQPPRQIVGGVVVYF